VLRLIDLVSAGMQTSPEDEVAPCPTCVPATLIA
jgi:hypothetical protein